MSSLIDLEREFFKVAKDLETKEEVKKTVSRGNKQYVRGMDR